MKNLIRKVKFIILLSIIMAIFLSTSVYADDVNSIFIYKAYIVGNTFSISNNISDELSKYDVERIDGVDKYDRNLKVINRFSDVNFNTVFLATGEDYLDSLSGVSFNSISNEKINLQNNSFKGNDFGDNKMQ